MNIKHEGFHTRISAVSIHSIDASVVRLQEPPVGASSAEHGSVGGEFIGGAVGVGGESVESLSQILFVNADKFIGDFEGDELGVATETEFSEIFHSSDIGVGGGTVLGVVSEPVDALVEVELLGVEVSVDVVFLIDRVLSSVVVDFAFVASVNESHFFGVVVFVEDIQILQIHYSQLETLGGGGNNQASLGDIVQIKSSLAFFT